MALKLDNALLDELGLGALPDSEKQLLLRQIYEKLEMNVGMRLADQMSNEQLDAFEKFVDANDDKGAFQWLESNFPNYKDVVNEEFEKLKAEIRSVAPQILASAQANQANQGQPQELAGQSQQQQPPMGQPQLPPASQQYAGQPPQQQGGQQPAVPPAYAQPAQPEAPQYQPPQPAQQQPVPQQQYQPQPAQPQYPPAGGAVPQNGHLQPQYGGPSEQVGQFQQPQAYPGQQPPAGPNQ